MYKPRLTYFRKEDVLHLTILEETAAGSTEPCPIVTAEFNVKGDLIGIEILNASSFLNPRHTG